MRTTALEIRHENVLGTPSLGLDRAMRDALAAYARIQWPTNTAKQAAKAWGLTLDEGRGLVAGRTSLATIDRILKSKNGGWAVALPVVGAVVGHGLDDFIATEKARHAAARKDLEVREQRLVEVARDLPAVLGLDRRGAGGLGDRRRREGRALGR